MTNEPQLSATPQGSKRDEAPSCQLGADQLVESKEYGRAQLRCTLLDLAVDLVFLSVMAFVIAAPLDRWLQGYGLLAGRWTRLAAFFLSVFLLHAAVGFPFSFYTGFLLEHRYGLSRQTFLRWLRRYGLRFLLSFALGLCLVEGLFVVIYLTGAWWWVAAAAGVFLVSVVLGRLAPVLILPLFYKVERLDDELLATRFQRLCTGTGLTIEGVYRMRMSSETAKANAMLAGLGRTRRVILSDTLLDSFTPDEIEVVFAHEVGHHVFGHLRKLLAAGLVLSIVSFLICDLSLRQYLPHVESGLDYGDLPVYSLSLMMLVVSVFSLVLSPLQNAISRHFERQCDRYALDRTGRQDAFRSAFTKLAALNKADPDPHPVEVVLFHDHPPIAQRIALADR